MSLFTRRRAIVPAATLLFAVATSAQTCYYPDGKSISTDIPCNPDAPDSACCGSNEFCLADGLCYGGGIVSRGSCTDSSWGAACPQICTDDDTSTAAVITPCTSGESSSTFACGLNATACSSGNTFSLSTDTSLVLRPAQIAALVGKSLQSSSVTTSTVTAIPSGYYTGGAMAGLAIGIAIPLLIALGVLYFLLRRERNKFGHASTNKNLMYKLPDDLADDFKPPPPPPVITTSHASHTNSFASNRSSHASATNSVTNSMAGSMVTSMAPSRRASKWTIQTASSRPVLSRDFPPNQSQTFLERYEVMKRNAAAQSQEVTISVASVPGTPSLGTPTLGTPRIPRTPSTEALQPQELDSTPTAEGPRYELSNTRMST